MKDSKHVLEYFDDRALVRAWQQGNERSFNQLFNRYFRTSYRYVHRMVCDRLTAEEITMDVMFSVWKKKEYIDPQVSILPFMLRTARNKAIDYMRRKKPQIVFQGDDDQMHSISSGFSADFFVDTNESGKIYEQLLSSLAPKRRLAFRLSRELDMSYAEIAKRMRLSKNTVENHIALALKDIRGYLQGAKGYRGL